MSRHSQIRFLAAAVLAAGLGAGAALAAPQEAAKPTPKPTVYAPVPGGMSQRLAPFAKVLDSGSKAEVEAKLRDLLSKSREDGHKMIDEIVDNGSLEAWLEAMGQEQGEAAEKFAKSLAGKPEATVRAALHSRLDRKLAEMGKAMKAELASADLATLKKSYGLAMRDLASEENHIMEAAVEVGVDTARGSLDPPPEGVPAAPRASYVYYGHGGQRAYNAGLHNGMTPGMQRTMAVAQQRAWFSNQLAAVHWNNRVNGFNRYLYGARMPSYASPRYRRGFPAGYYYRPDRVERVVRRGLWGAAAVAATPFALAASLF